ncbi:hypothetical protein SAMN05216419_1001100 [Nitrosomonas cryotolerans]|uniref:DUF484 family protein n=1 Tax=Nitrosomonas cryotolerans ATCC 49181 TaxID=1131553 RepID=A0A1N6IPD7_9PROT|nr:DUF484 family protein [Nitrosomonas cryotolerans]SFP35317.1 hypothetical protein SAMN05216419_1001100 [Nitrosomonas cryotolerans]SIO33898.1 hypothetical protein SAMN02743940_1965 [Nitrosomonas cryotolerans ATCC 49181]
MKSEEVIQYLQDNPQFFSEYADILANIHVPHPYDSKVISINERQIITLRDKNRALQDRLLELINFGEENDAIGEKMHRLSIKLLTVSSIDELLEGLNNDLREDFSIPHVALRLWDISCNDMERIEFTVTSEDIHTISESLTYPYCGTHIADEIKNWFGKDASDLQSFSMIPLKVLHPIGLLVLGSPEAKRFYSEMGTLYLKRLGELTSAAFARFDLKTGILKK